MKGYCAPFESKKVTLLGLGLLGRGVGDAEFLARCGARIVVTDKKNEEELAESVARLRPFANIAFHLGGHRKEDFTDADLVVKAAGVPLDSPEITWAREAGVEVAMSTALFSKYAAKEGTRIVGITGTRGKSTVTHMMYHTLKMAGRRVHLGGNVRGLSTLSLLPEVRRGDIAVLELDSWQLQGFGDLRISPHLAVFTNLMPDHMHYYHGDKERYFADKANIFKFQKEGDVLVVGPRAAKRVQRARPPVEPLVPEKLPEAWALKVPGEHNRDNAALAAAALFSLGLTSDLIREGLESFEGVEGRLQLVAERGGVQIYNDNNATTPEATIAALRAVARGKNVVLIAGGSDKGLDMSGMRAAIHAHCKGVVLLSGTGTERIRSDAPDVPVFGSLADALNAALALASAGDVVLFSPAFASFGMFKNEYDRNDQFLRLVQEV